MRGVRLTAALATVLLAAGCTQQVTGTAVRDPVTAPLAISDDGFGIVTGFDDAPVHIEIFTEPQCTHCAHLQSEFGDSIGYYIGIGALNVTYRPLTFLDENGNEHSARVSNALFLAADGPNQKATGTQFQGFVEQLWAQQDPGGPGPSDDEMADIARGLGMPDDVVAQIASGGSAVDIIELNEANIQLLASVGDDYAGTPTVYGVDADRRIDLADEEWLDKLMS